MFRYIFHSLSYNVLILWILFVLSPCYIILASGMMKFYVILNSNLKSKSFFLYKYVGDLSWTIPFKSEADIKPVNILLTAIFLALLSILIIGTVFWSYFTEYTEKKLQIKVSDIKKQK